MEYNTYSLQSSIKLNYKTIARLKKKEKKRVKINPILEMK